MLSEQTRSLNTVLKVLLCFCLSSRHILLLVPAIVTCALVNVPTANFLLYLVFSKAFKESAGHQIFCDEKTSGIKYVLTFMFIQ